MNKTSIVTATRSFEGWLAAQIPVVRNDIARKHAAMATDPFVFLRATFYRWAQVFPDLCSDLMQAPVVRAVCDLHVENYSTWRDVEGRLIWGINDFDEAHQMPYTIDLVRLGTSTKLAIRSTRLSIRVKDACEVLLEGYREALSTGVKPIVLAEENIELATIVSSKSRSPRAFWNKLDAQVDRRVRVTRNVRDVLLRHLPEPCVDCEFGSRVAGKGSLGRPRFVALGQWNGARIAREAKRVVPSACVWAELERLDGQFAASKDRSRKDQSTHRKDSGESPSSDKQLERVSDTNQADRVIRSGRISLSGDPSVTLDGDWSVRRLAPDCSRVEFADLPSNANAEVLLRSMGREAANVHMGTAGSARKILANLDRLPADWLSDAVKVMTRSVREDHEAWKRHMQR